MPCCPWGGDLAVLIFFVQKGLLRSNFFDHAKKLESRLKEEIPLLHPSLRAPSLPHPSFGHLLQMEKGNGNNFFEKGIEVLRINSERNIKRVLSFYKKTI
jgi:hypothetical protein